MESFAVEAVLADEVYRDVELGTMAYYTRIVVRR